MSQYTSIPDTRFLETAQSGNLSFKDAFYTASPEVLVCDGIATMFIIMAMMMMIYKIYYL